MEHTMEEAKAHEREVCRLLNLYPDCDYKVEAKDNSRNDLYGMLNGQRSYVEVKWRSRKYKYPIIGPTKCRAIFAKGKKNHVKHYFLAYGFENECYLYDLKRIWEFGQRTISSFNKTTSVDIEGSGVKVEKEVIRFEYDDYIVKLGTTEVGSNYEVMPLGI